VRSKRQGAVHRQPWQQRAASGAEILFCGNIHANKEALKRARETDR
jgi:hypothetical protein